MFSRKSHTNVHENVVDLRIYITGPYSMCHFFSDSKLYLHCVSLFIILPWNKILRMVFFFYIFSSRSIFYNKLFPQTSLVFEIRHSKNEYCLKNRLKTRTYQNEISHDRNYYCKMIIIMVYGKCRVLFTQVKVTKQKRILLQVREHIQAH